MEDSTTRTVVEQIFDKLDKCDPKMSFLAWITEPSTKKYLLKLEKEQMDEEWEKGWDESDLSI